MPNPDDLNAELDQAALEAIREFFNQPTEPGTHLHHVQVEIAKGLIAAGPFDTADKARLLDRNRPAVDRPVTDC